MGMTHPHFGNRLHLHSAAHAGKRRSRTGAPSLLDVKVSETVFFPGEKFVFQEEKVISRLSEAPSLKKSEFE